jgi:hypothetical protein
MFAFCKSSSHHSKVPPKPSFKKLLLGSRLWHHAKMSTSLKSPDGLKDTECEKRQLSHWPPIRTFLWLISSCPSKNPRSSRSSFLMLPTSACPSTPVGTRLYFPIDKIGNYYFTYYLKKKLGTPYFWK